MGPAGTPPVRRGRGHGDVAVRPAGEPRVHRQAEPGVAAEAVLAEAAGDVERHHDAVALLQTGDAAADLFDDAEVLVAEHDAWLRGRATFVHVQVGPADARRGDL